MYKYKVCNCFFVCVFIKHPDSTLQVEYDVVSSMHNEVSIRLQVDDKRNFCNVTATITVQYQTLIGMLMINWMLVCVN